MNWAHLFMPNESPDYDGAGSLDVDSSFLIPNSDFFENLPHSSSALPPRPPSIPPDLEPAPLFTPTLAPLSNPGGTEGSTQHLSASAQASNALGLCFDSVDSLLPRPAGHSDHQQLQPHAYSSTGLSSKLAQLPAPLPLPADTLFDNNEESYLNSFLNSFDADSFDLGTYLASPPPMPDFSSNTDFTGMGMGMGVGAGMMSAMDDSIPHLSLDENAHDTTRGMSHLPAPSSANAGAYPHAAGSNMLPMRRQSFFDYGLTGTGNVPLGNTISEEMHKVSSWLLQSQGHQPEALQPYSASSAAFPIPTVHRSSIDGSQHATHAFLSHSMGLTSPLGRPPDFPATTPARVLSASAARGTFSTDIWAHNPYNGYAPQARPPSDSELSIKRKASHEQIDQPRKARGNVWSPVRETAPSLLPASSAAGAAYDGQCNGAITNMMRIGQALALSTGDGGDDVHAHGDVADANSAAGGDEGSADGERSNRQDGRRNQQKAVLTESERRANHIASEQRRRNQIRQGYAELMDLVTTLRDPALGNHPGTAQSTPSKAVILAHAVQFIRGLEEGNRLLRKRLEGTRHFLPPMHFASQALAALRSHSNDPPQ